ncbi:MAG: 2-oxoglutarate and iron-dependent oxygenase domain-containing protein [bacterium]|nr:2-oxoglutarate and iron-dependent oxygenase domain-containing protein [bacterium]
MQKAIPVLECVDAPSAQAVTTLGEAFRDIGFVFVRTPDITRMLFGIWPAFRATFDLPQAIKQKYARPDIFYQRGWTPPFTELAIACRRLGKDEAGLPDAKENWFMGPNLDPLSDIVRRFPEHYPQNIWPSEVPSLKPAMERLYGALLGVGSGVLALVERYMGKPEGYFAGIIRDSPTVMRAINYPPVGAEDVGRIIWACQHTDINLITVLPASTRKGLWIRRRDGEWISGTAPEGCTIVQVADMLDYLTGGHFMSAAHEVRTPEYPTQEGRLSAALFIHARSDVLLEPDVSGADAAQYPPITAGELLLKRLRAIGLAV